MSFLDNIKDEVLQEVVNNATTFADILRHYKMSHASGNYKTLRRVFDKQGIDYSHIKQGSHHNLGRKFGNKKPLDEFIETYCQKDTHTNRGMIKSRLLQEGIIENKCCKCGLDGEWENNPIIMILDHINGVNNDNRLENLRMVCPNCNSQLDTHCGKHRRNITFCECGVEIRKVSKKCAKCSSTENGLKQRKVERPPLEVLLQDVSDTSYRKTGEKYGVSDNAIRKWIKDYGGTPPRIKKTK